MSEDPAPANAPADPSGVASRRKPGARRRRAALVISIVWIAIMAWGAHFYLTHADLPSDLDDELALSVAGGWWNIAGDRHLTLILAGHRAVLRDFSTLDEGVDSVGIWRTTRSSVIVDVNGAAGHLVQRLEPVGNDAELFLAPIPSMRARLVDVWIADHDDDDEDMSPSDSTSREARLRSLKISTAHWTSAAISSKFCVH